MHPHLGWVASVLKRLGPALVFLGLDWSFLPQAYGFECARIGKFPGPSAAWFKRNIPYAFHARGTRSLPREETFDALRKSFGTWQNVEMRSGQPYDCKGILVPGSPLTTGLRFVEQPSTQQDHVGYNFLEPDSNQNILIFQDDPGSYPLDAADPTGDVIALTTTTYNAVTGEIFDADIEFNSARFHFTLQDKPVSVDLRNTATHEIGHFIGLGHSDDPTSSMWAKAESAEILKRTLSCDDAAALLFRYPSTSDQVGYCAPDAIDATCGYCAPPRPLRYTAQVQILDRNDGMGGCQCQSTGTYGLIGWILSRRWRRGAQAWYRRLCRRFPEKPL